MVQAKNSPYIVGIDLGTSNSTASIFTSGESKVIPIDNDPVLPSVVHVRDSGEVIVGRKAKKLLLVDPANTVASIKREMGNSKYEKEFDGLPGKKYSPTDLSAEILSKIREALEESSALDLRGTVKYAVICIPANFDDVKKHATLEAARLAGFEVIRLLEEPVAAAITYASDAQRDQKILVYDLGGGTFDVSILNVDSTGVDSAEFNILAKEGIPYLGGDDFDKAIMEIVARDFYEKTELDIFDLKKDQGINRKALRQAQQNLKEIAEAAKIELAEAMSAMISIPNFLKDETGIVHNIELEITRQDFENAIRELLMSTRATMQKALESAELTIDDISRIILVGGSTRVPLVREVVTEMFDKEPYCDMDPATAVARGAAIMGAVMGPPAEEDVADVLPQDTPDVKINITDIVTHNLGIQIKNGKFDQIIKKGMQIPGVGGLVKDKEYVTQRDDMTEIRIAVYQSLEQPEFVTDVGCVCIGEFFLTGIPPRKKGEINIDVSFELNHQNLLTVNAITKDESGIKNTLTIDRNVGLN